MLVQLEGFGCGGLGITAARSTKRTPRKCGARLFLTGWAIKYVSRPPLLKPGGMSKLSWKGGEMKTKTKTQHGKRPMRHAGALCASCAGSPACVFVFVFVLIYVEFDMSKNWVAVTSQKSRRHFALVRD